MSLGPLYVFLGEVSVQVLCPFFNWVVCVPGVQLCEFFIYLEIRPLSEVSLEICFPYSWFSFHFNAVFFSHAEAFHFDEVPLFILSIMSLALGDILVKILLHGMSEIFLLMVFSRTIIVSQLIFKSFIHLEFIFVYVISW